MKTRFWAQRRLDDDATFRNNIGLMDDGALPDFKVEEGPFANYCVHYTHRILLDFAQYFGDTEFGFPSNL